MRGGDGTYVRVGSAGDGAYVMYDDFGNDGIAYSLGIGDNVDWDLDMAARGFDIYMYDYSIEMPPYANEHFHFYAERVGRPGKSLAEILRENGHSDRDDLILKMDIEAAEWELLRDVDSETLVRFQQIIVELHFPFDLFRVYAEPLLEKINRTHQIVHIHANNVGGYDVLDGIKFPMYLEVTWLRRKDHMFKKSTRSFPTNLDCGNITDRNDISLGMWNEPIRLTDEMPFQS